MINHPHRSKNNPVHNYPAAATIEQDGYVLTVTLDGVRYKTARGQVMRPETNDEVVGRIARTYMKLGEPAF
jgi:hypothetical protein